MTPDTRKAFDSIIDCFTEADGGVALTNLQGMIKAFDSVADDETRQGNDAAAIINIVRRFGRLTLLASDPSLLGEFKRSQQNEETYD